MRIKFPEDDARTKWTRHIKNKMLYYGLSEQRIRNVFNMPDRTEEGIAENTLAAVKRAKQKKKPEEIWIMYQKITNDNKLITNNKKSHKSGTKFVMISAWRYPGITKPGSPIPIPADILEELIK